LFLGDAAETLRRLPAGIAQTIVTSPPYYGLRDYGCAGQLGREASPGEYVDALTGVLDAAARVLRPDGVVWLNLGDTYSSRANGGPSSRRHTGRGHRNIAGTRVNTTSGAPLKSLLLMPARVSLALVERGWIVRNDIVWHKPNAMPESVQDRLSARHEHVFLLARRPCYLFDLDSIKVAAQHRSSGGRRGREYAAAVGTGAAARRYGANESSTLATAAHAERNPGDVWTMATRGSSAEHFAMFPIDLPLRCVAAGSRPGDLVVDPFSGMATTGKAALRLGRRYLGIDLNPVYLDAAGDELDRLTRTEALL
jgi:site-specific DNA-methyltransferase (cytosine-N4-specific)